MEAESGSSADDGKEPAITDARVGAAEGRCTLARVRRVAGSTNSGASSDAVPLRRLVASAPT
jgi:hypothetical protein